MKNFVTGKLKMVVLRCSKIKDIFILLYVCVAAGGGGNVDVRDPRHLHGGQASQFHLNFRGLMKVC